MTDQVPQSARSQEEAGEKNRPLRIAVVAMKPQLRGRIRRNIMTFLELGAEVTVVNTPPRDDFFVGLSSPRLRAEFVDVRSAAVRYQAWMTRQNVVRKEKWAREQERSKARAPLPDAPEWMKSDALVATLAYKGWTSSRGTDLRRLVKVKKKALRKNAVRSGRELRKKRDLTVRDGLKKFHLINRFVEFWRMSPARIAALDPDLIVSSDLPGLVGASIAAKRLRRPHLHDCHELYLESTTLKRLERVLLWPIEKRYMRRADSVVVVNRTIRDEYRKRYGVQGLVLRNCAPEVSASVRLKPVDVRGLLGLAPEDHVVLYQGGLMVGRGLDVCVRAAAGFPDGAHLIFIGEGRMRDDLVALAKHAGVQDRVHWLPAVQPGELPTYTAAASVGLIPYQPVSKNNHYALPNKVFEYTGAGVPFIASDLPELRRIVTASGCGEVYDPFSPDQLAAAVHTVLDPQRYSTYRRNAEVFGHENTWETERKILIAEVHRLIGQPAAMSPVVRGGASMLQVDGPEATETGAADEGELPFVSR